MPEPTVSETPSDCPCRRSCQWRNALPLVAVVAFGFIAGQAAQKWYGRHPIGDKSQGQRQFFEFLAVAANLGIVTVDRERLDEIICIVAEAEWEDRDAVQYGEEGFGK